MALKGAITLLCLVSSAFGTCPAGTIYESYFNKCYKYFPQLVSWLAGEKSCNSIGSSLVTVSNGFENTYIHGIAEEAGSIDSYWIGMNQLMSPQWSWINGDNSTYQNWAPGEPSTPGYSCGAVRIENDQWTKEYCTTGKPYICQIDPNAAPINGCPTTTASPVTVTTAKPSGSCPNGHCPDPSYTLNPNTCKCYKFYDDGPKYNESAQVCLSYSATLPIILDEADNQFIANFTYQNCDFCNPWIGLSCTTSNSSSCTWQDGTPLGYSNFDSGVEIANDAIYIKVGDNGRWYTCPFEWGGSYLCQQMGIRTPQEPRSFKGSHQHKSTNSVVPRQNRV